MHTSIHACKVSDVVQNISWNITFKIVLLVLALFDQNQTYIDSIDLTKRMYLYSNMSNFNHFT